MFVAEFYDQWPFQDPKLEVPTIYKAYVIPIDVIFGRYNELDNELVHNYGIHGVYKLTFTQLGGFINQSLHIIPIVRFLWYIPMNISIIPWIMD
jgi:hypothetical protein